MFCEPGLRRQYSDSPRAVLLTKSSFNDVARCLNSDIIERFSKKNTVLAKLRWI
jgi:hypothetical protein